jgi:hypothetical protein
MSDQISLLDGDRFAPGADLLDVDSCQRKWMVEPGEVFTFDGRTAGHVLICGDARSRAVADLAVRLVGRTRRRIAIIDPPYGIKYRSSSKERLSDTGKPLVSRRVDADFGADEFDTSWMPTWKAAADPKAVYLFSGWTISARWREAMTRRRVAAQGADHLDKMRRASQDQPHHPKQRPDMRSFITRTLTRALAAAHITMHTSREPGLLRGWFNVTGPGERYDSLASFEVSTGGFNVGASVSLVDDCEGGLRASIGLGPMRLFLGTEHRAARALATRLAPYMGKDFYGRSAAKLGAELYAMDGDAIARLYLGGNVDSGAGPSHYYNLKDVLLGQPVYTPGEGPAELRTIHLAEGPYVLSLRKSESTWKRPRWPGTKRSRSFEWSVVSNPEGRTGLPVPGKGENSYDCDEDAVFGGSIPARNADEACGRIVGSVMHDRARRAGPGWTPGPVRPREDPSPNSEAMSA